MNKNKLNLTLILLAVVAIVVMGVSCTKNAAKAESPATGDDGGAQKTSAAKPVAKIVFVDKENCCKCTGERTEKSWNALMAALKGKSTPIPVERVHVDTQADQAAKYKAKKSMVAIPALYFLDADGNLVEMLQGEIKQEQVEKLL